MDWCSSCGAPIPIGQGVCSMCYGDIGYGEDGYYLEYMQEVERHEEEKRLEEERQGQSEMDE